MNKEQIEELRQYYLDRVSELKADCASGTPWVFISAMSLLHQLTNLSKGHESSVSDIIFFIVCELGIINPLYRNFKYNNRHTSLATQMYYNLYQGLLKRFSFQGSYEGGENNSIVICHRQENLVHLSNYSLHNDSYDAALIVAEDLVEDLEKVINNIFGKALIDQHKWLWRNIECFSEFYTPIGIIK